MRFPHVLLASLVPFLFAVALHAQDAGAAALPTWHVGVTGAFSRNFHTGGMFPFEEDDTCGCETSRGAGTGWQAGIAARLQLSPSFGLDARLTYDTRPGLFERRYEMPGIGPDRPTMVVLNDIEYRLVTLEALATAGILRVDPLSVSVAIGPSVSSVLSGRSKLSQEVIGASGEIIRSTSIEESEIDELASTRISVKGGASVDARLGEDFLVRLGAYYDRGLTDVTSAENWQVHSLLVQLDLLYHL
jgi:hypothetical protein